MKKAAFFSNNQERLNSVYLTRHKETLAALTTFYPHVITSENFAEHAPQLHDLQVIFSTWGMPALSVKQLDALPNLEAVFYAAGSVQAFAPALLERRVLLAGARHAIGEAVVEFVLAQILLANKGYFRNIRDCSTPQGRAQSPFRGRGNFGATIAILGAGAIGRRLIERLGHFRLNVIVFDPFLDKAEAQQLGVEKVSLQEAFARADVVTNHMAAKPETDKIINRALLESLRENATFINTARGQAVDETALAEVWRARPDLTALLDVTSPEPPRPDSPFYELPNILLSSHIAGSLGEELQALADSAIEQFQEWQRGEQPRGIVTAKALARMA